MLPEDSVLINPVVIMDGLLDWHRQKHYIYKLFCLIFLKNVINLPSHQLHVDRFFPTVYVCCGCMGVFINPWNCKPKKKPLSIRGNTCLAFRKPNRSYFSIPICNNCAETFKPA